MCTFNDGCEGDACFFSDANQRGNVLQPLRVWNRSGSACKLCKEAGQLQGYKLCGGAGCRGWRKARSCGSRSGGMALTFATWALPHFRVSTYVVYNLILCTCRQFLCWSMVCGSYFQFLCLSLFLFRVVTSAVYSGWPGNRNWRYRVVDVKISVVMYHCWKGSKMHQRKHIPSWLDSALLPLHHQ